MAVTDPAIDANVARNSTKVFLVVNGARIGRVQSFREDIANNVQVLAELGRDVMVELKKGITAYTFSIARFYCRKDVFDDLKFGQVFSLLVRDGATVSSDNLSGGPETLEYFKQCSIQSISRDYTVGQATVAENATVVTIGKGVTSPS